MARPRLDTCRACGANDWYSYPYGRRCRPCERRRQNRRLEKPEARAAARATANAWRAGNRERAMVTAARKRARAKGLPFNITAEDVVIPERCPVLGTKLTLAGGKRDTSPSLDRIEPKKGYRKGNVRVISFRANTLKSNATVEELEAVLRDAKSR